MWSLCPPVVVGQRFSQADSSQLNQDSLGFELFAIFSNRVARCAFINCTLGVRYKCKTVADALAAAAVLVGPPAQLLEEQRLSPHRSAASAFEARLQLLDLPVQLLRRTPELHATQFGDQQLQLLDLAVVRHDQFVFSENDSSAACCM